MREHTLTSKQREGDGIISQQPQTGDNPDIHPEKTRYRN